MRKEARVKGVKQQFNAIPIHFLRLNGKEGMQKAEIVGGSQESTLRVQNAVTKFDRKTASETLRSRFHRYVTNAKFGSVRGVTSSLEKRQPSWGLIIATSISPEKGDQVQKDTIKKRIQTIYSQQHKPEQTIFRKPAFLLRRTSQDASCSALTQGAGSTSAIEFNDTAPIINPVEDKTPVNKVQIVNLTEKLRKEKTITQDEPEVKSMRSKDVLIQQRIGQITTSASFSGFPQKVTIDRRSSVKVGNDSQSKKRGWLNVIKRGKTQSDFGHNQSFANGTTFYKSNYFHKTVQNAGFQTQDINQGQTTQLKQYSGAMLLASRSKQRTKNFFTSESTLIPQHQHHQSLTHYSSTGFHHDDTNISDYHNTTMPSHRKLLEQKRMKSKSHMYNYDQIQLLTDKRYFKDVKQIEKEIKQLSIAPPNPCLTQQSPRLNKIQYATQQQWLNQSSMHEMMKIQDTLFPRDDIEVLQQQYRLQEPLMTRLMSNTSQDYITTSSPKEHRSTINPSRVLLRTPGVYEGFERVQMHRKKQRDIIFKQQMQGANDLVLQPQLMMPRSKASIEALFEKQRSKSIVI
ncbi:hypothetical protein FGO68_gene11397 [Halteria grandinella]|uniref:Uncharacterized protein n=1 Tax=Halteria grandinella TaxID=5974 RepID=A0A8J8T416_HALGN|nr:hypothetical protein FGO68_gene11397 [Halteria grandinella]